MRASSRGSEARTYLDKDTEFNRNGLRDDGSRRSDQSMALGLGMGGMMIPSRTESADGRVFSLALTRQLPPTIGTGIANGERAVLLQQSGGQRLVGDLLY